ncbi:MAG: PhzF family phenazine biosynthesis protein [Pseudomonadota bacterium]
MDIQCFAVFSHCHVGGNPAGVAVTDKLTNESEMQCITVDMGDSGAVFASRNSDGSFRARYFSRESEVVFWKNATIGQGTVLSEKYGAAKYTLQLDHSSTVVERVQINDELDERFESPAGKSAKSHIEVDRRSAQ